MRNATRYPWISAPLDIDYKVSRKPDGHRRGENIVVVMDCLLGFGLGIL